MKLRPKFDDLPFSSMQTNSASIIIRTKRNPIIEITEICFIKSRPYSAWQVYIKRQGETPESAYFRTENEAHNFVDYLDGLTRKESNQKGVVGYYQHINLGVVEINDICLKLQNINPDETSIFVIHNGEIKEVTKSAIHPLKLQKQKENNL